MGPGQPPQDLAGNNPHAFNSVSCIRRPAEHLASTASLSDPSCVNGSMTCDAEATCLCLPPVTSHLADSGAGESKIFMGHVFDWFGPRTVFGNKISHGNNQVSGRRFHQKPLDLIAKESGM